MATPAPATLPNNTDGIRDFLQGKYDPDSSDSGEDAHIDCFYIRVGKGADQEGKVKELKEATNDLQHVDQLGWSKSLFFAVISEDKKKVENKDEQENKREQDNKREQEASFNETYRQHPLYSKFKKMGAIISRACLYCDKDEGSKENQQNTTKQIGILLKDVYDLHPIKDPTKMHIKHFYLFVQVPDSTYSEKVNDLALEELEILPGDWKPVEPKETWDGTFFGFFPKTTAPMTEREREKQLNRDVRKPLIEKLKEKLKETEGSDKEHKVEVIITRACIYT